ncbi:MAG: hypothetical protein KBC84_06990 [Proteobacteria bacterium]|nr:hypothetical protein [Pseudomonadota bacterium]
MRETTARLSARRNEKNPAPAKPGRGLIHQLRLAKSLVGSDDRATPVEAVVHAELDGVEVVVRAEAVLEVVEDALKEVDLLVSVSQKNGEHHIDVSKGKQLILRKIGVSNPAILQLIAYRIYFKTLLEYSNSDSSSTTHLITKFAGTLTKGLNSTEFESQVWGELVIIVALNTFQNNIAGNLERLSNAGLIKFSSQLVGNSKDVDTVIRPNDYGLDKLGGVILRRTLALSESQKVLMTRCLMNLAQMLGVNAYRRDAAAARFTLIPQLVSLDPRPMQTLGYKNAVEIASRAETVHRFNIQGTFINEILLQNGLNHALIAIGLKHSRVLNPIETIFMNALNAMAKGEDLRPVLDELSKMQASDIKSNSDRLILARIIFLYEILIAAGYHEMVEGIVGYSKKRSLLSDDMLAYLNSINQKVYELVGVEYLKVIYCLLNSSRGKGKYLTTLIVDNVRGERKLSTKSLNPSFSSNILSRNDAETEEYWFYLGSCYVHANEESFSGLSESEIKDKVLTECERIKSEAPFAKTYVSVRAQFLRGVIATLNQFKFKDAAHEVFLQSEFGKRFETLPVIRPMHLAYPANDEIVKNTFTVMQGFWQVGANVTKTGVQERIVEVIIRDNPVEYAKFLLASPTATSADYLFISQFLREDLVRSRNNYKFNHAYAQPRAKAQARVTEVLSVLNQSLLEMRALVEGMAYDRQQRYLQEIKDCEAEIRNICIHILTEEAILSEDQCIFYWRMYQQKTESGSLKSIAAHFFLTSEIPVVEGNFSDTVFNGLRNNEQSSMIDVLRELLLIYSVKFHRKDPSFLFEKLLAGNLI